MDKAAALGREAIFAVGNAPTALIRLYELIKEGKLKPALIIGAPVGFVNVVESKELIMEAGVPFIVPKGEKAAATLRQRFVTRCCISCKNYFLKNEFE